MQTPSTGVYVPLQTPSTTSTEFSRLPTPNGSGSLQMTFSTNKKINGSQNVKSYVIAPSSLNNRSVNTPMNRYGVPVIKVIDKASRGGNVAEKGRREVADPEKGMVGTSVKYSGAVRNVSIGSRPTSLKEVATGNTSFSRFGMIGRLQNVSNCTSCGK